MYMFQKVAIMLKSPYSFLQPSPRTTHSLFISNTHKVRFLSKSQKWLFSVQTDTDGLRNTKHAGFKFVGLFCAKV